MSTERQELTFLGRMFDPAGDVTTEFFIEPPGGPGPRQEAKTRHLIARSSDGRPEFKTSIPDNWSEVELMRLVTGNAPPESSDQDLAPLRAEKRNHDGPKFRLKSALIKARNRFR
jgi:hypothetical protein